MKKAVIVLVLGLGAAGCATTVGPDGYEESFGHSVARGFAEGLFDAMFDRMLGDGDGGGKASPPQKRWLAQRVSQTSVSSPR